MKDEELIDQMRKAVTIEIETNPDPEVYQEHQLVNDACLLSLANMVREHDFAKMDVISAEQHDNEVRADERARFKAEVIEAGNMLFERNPNNLIGYGIKILLKAIEEL